jgi:anti-sigma factor RsiW
MEHDFDILAARVLSGEATPEQRKRLEQMMEQDDELRSEFDELRATWATLKNAAPLVSAFDEAPTMLLPSCQRSMRRPQTRRLNDSENGNRR